MKHIHFDTISSTNSYLKENYQEFDNFAFISADYQFCGKGRYERKWISEKGKNLLFSLLIKDEQLLNSFNVLSLVSAVSICEYLEKTLKIKNVSIKWPNDVFVNNKKICGILLEGQIPHYVVIGIGLNVNQRKFAGEFNNSPTSISKELGHDIDIYQLKNDLFKMILEKFSKLLDKKVEFFNYFANHNYLINKHVSFEKDGITITGRVIEIDEDFQIQIKTEYGVEKLSSGEIFLEK